MSNLDHKGNIELPNSFESLVEISLQPYKDELVAAIKQSNPPVSIRLHPVKGDNALSNDVVAWCSNGRYLTERPVFTLDPLFHAGCYYVQEASSMILHSILHDLALPENPVILDLCAAPGGKSTIILDYLKGKGHLLANEVIRSRVGILEDNIIRWGYNNVVVTNNDPADFAALGPKFDLVMVDAPCSGEGMFRKDPDSIKEWSEENVDLCSSRQKRILSDALPLLKGGGFLIYSTCTYNEKENMDNVTFLSQSNDLENLHLDWAKKAGAVELSKQDLKGYQMIPGKIKGEGYFFAVFRKKSEAAPVIKNKPLSRIKPLTKNEKSMLSSWFKPEYLDQLRIHDNGDLYIFNESLSLSLELYLKILKVKYAGIKTGQLTKDVFTPDHALALSVERMDTRPAFELNKHDALRFLNKSLTTINSQDKSWILITYKSKPLGWVKNLGNRINNYLPAHLRIHMDISAI
ncbi:MAG: hypothetical protein U0V54_03805 [Saprospiraceae bacterium]